MKFVGLQALDTACLLYYLARAQVDSDSHTHKSRFLYFFSSISEPKKHDRLQLKQGRTSMPDWIGFLKRHFRSFSSLGANKNCPKKTVGAKFVLCFFTDNFRFCCQFRIGP